MTPDTLASILDAHPYPGAVVTASHAVVSLTFDAFTLRYHADGWRVEALHLESLLNEYSAPEAVAAEIRRILKTVFAIKVGAALSDAEALDSVDPVEYLTDLAAEKMLAILDVAALASARQAKIASNVADAAARDMRIADLERIIEATHKVFDGVGVAWSVGSDAGRLTLPKRAEYAVSPGFLAGAERKALETQIASLVRDLAAKDASLKTAHAALNDIADAIGAPPPVCPDDMVDEVQALLVEVKRATDRADRAEATLAETVKALDDAGAPSTYDGGGEIGGAERIRLLGDRWRAERDEWQIEATHAAQRLDAIRDAHEALDERGVPRQAGLVKMSPAARIRAIPR